MMATRAKLSQKMQSVLTAVQEGHSAPDTIIVATGLNASTVRSYVRRLEQEGYIVRDARGAYTANLDAFTDTPRIEDVGERIKSVRGRRSQQVFAGGLGVAVRTVTNWEGGGKVAESMLALISVKERVNFEWLKTGEGFARRPGSEEELTIGQRLALVMEQEGLERKDIAALLSGANEHDVEAWLRDDPVAPEPLLLQVSHTVGYRLQWLRTGEGQVFDPQIRQRLRRGKTQLAGDGVQTITVRNQQGHTVAMVPVHKGYTVEMG